MKERESIEAIKSVMIASAKLQQEIVTRIIDLEVKLNEHCKRGDTCPHKSGDKEGSFDD